MDLDFIVAESREARLPQLTPRRATVPDIPNKAAVLIGMRRSGKTYLMYQEMQRLLASGVDRRDVLYVNFEDDRLQPAEPGLLSDLLEAYYRAPPAPRERRAYLFLDEIQMVPGWPRFVRRILTRKWCVSCSAGPRPNCCTPRSPQSCAGEAWPSRSSHTAWPRHCSPLEIRFP